MREAFGRVNTEHPHTLPFADLPLVSRNLLGGEALADSGLSVARLVPDPLASSSRRRARSTAASRTSSRRRPAATCSTSAGCAPTRTSPSPRTSTSAARSRTATTASPRTRRRASSAPTSRCATGRCAARSTRASSSGARRVWSRREDPAGAVDAFGAYGYLGYQFARRWTAGVRLDTSERADDRRRPRQGRLVHPDLPAERVQPRPRAVPPHRPSARRARSNELLFQFLFAIGAHGAHPF